MSRPMYETGEDRANEEQVIGDFCEYMRRQRGGNVTAVKLKKAYEADYAIVDGARIMAFAEVKCRNYTLKQLGNVWLSYAKWSRLKGFAQDGFTALLVFRFNCGMYWHRITPTAEPQLAIGGRTDRNDWQDQEPVVLIDSSSWHRFDRGEAHE